MSNYTFHGSGSDPKILQNLVGFTKKLANRKKDYIIHTSQLVCKNGFLFTKGSVLDHDLGSKGNDPLADLLSGTNIGVQSNKVTGKLNLLDIADSGLANALEINKRYYDRIKAESDSRLFDANVNWWLKSKDKEYTFRTYKTGRNTRDLRAILSKSYLRLDNDFMLLSVMDSFKKVGLKDLKIDYVYCCEKGLNLNVFSKQIKTKATNLLKDYSPEPRGSGDGICAGFNLSNSETGSGGWSITPRVVTLVCTNGMLGFKNLISQKTSGIHRGSNNEVLYDKKLQIIKMQIEVCIEEFMNKETLLTIVDKFGEFKSTLKNPFDTIKQIAKSNSFSEKELDSALSYFSQQGDHSSTGVIHAVTYMAAETNHNRRKELETLAGSFLDLGAERFISRYDRKLELANV